MQPHQKLAAIVSHLGGPKTSSAEMEWVNDIPAGKALVQWLADQLVPMADENDEEMLQASLRDIALHKEEVDMLNKTKSLGLVTSETSDSNEQTLLDYPHLETLKSQEISISAEAELIEHEVDRLRYRLRQIKRASQATAQTASTLREALSKADASIQVSQDSLTEASILADISVDAATTANSRLLEEIKLIQIQDEQLKILKNTEPVPSMLATYFASSRDYNEAAQKLSSSIEEYQLEGNRLHSILSADTILTSSALEKAYQEELENLRLQLERGGDLQADQDEDAELDLTHTRLDVHGELKRAWLMDNFELLRTRKQALDQTISILSSETVSTQPHLATLTQLEAHVRESEALGRALLEELEDVSRDILIGSEHQRQEGDLDGDKILENEIIHIIKRSGTQYASRVLLDRADIIQVLSDIRNDAIQRANGLWDADIISNDLCNIHLPRGLLHAAYEHTPLPASSRTLFPPPMNLQALEQNVRCASDRLAEKERELSANVKEAELFLSNGK